MDTEHTADKERRRIPVELNDAGETFMAGQRRGPGALTEEERFQVALGPTDDERRVAVYHAGDAIGAITGSVAAEIEDLFEECGRRRIEAECDDLPVDAAVEEAEQEDGPRLVLLLPPPDRLLQELVIEED